MGRATDLGNRLGRHARIYLEDRVSMARDFIYKRAFGITSAAVEKLLKETSSVPTKARLSQTEIVHGVLTQRSLRTLLLSG